MIPLVIDKKSPIPLIRQLYNAIRSHILSGKLASGSRLPASRYLALQLEISRNVVLEAYDLLNAEGYLETRRGSGTYVADGAAMMGPSSQASPSRISAAKIDMGYDAPEGVINFKPGTPDLQEFPKKKWLAMMKRVLQTGGGDIFAYGHPEGRKELRDAICRYVVTHREVACEPEQILITAGTTQAIGIVCHLLLKEKKDVILEDPITHDIQLIAGDCGGRINPIEVDNDGIVTSCLPNGLHPAFVYATPSHQFPIGGTLPIQRRLELIKYAKKRDCYIVEDDYDSEFRFDGPPLSSLHGLCPERVIYIGTFSKTLCPAIRIGYIILPEPLISEGRNRKWHSDLHNEVLSQLALAEFISQGHYLKHLVKMRKLYKRRRHYLCESLKHKFGNKVQVLGSSTGLHLAARFQSMEFSRSLLKEIEQNGARFYSAELHTISKGRYADTLLIGYGNLDVEEIRKGIEILSYHLQQYRNRKASVLYGRKKG